MLECNSCCLRACQCYLLMQLSAVEPPQGRHFKSSVFKHLLDEIHKRADMNWVINPVHIYAGSLKWYQ